MKLKEMKALWYPQTVKSYLHGIPWGLAVFLCLTLGLAPYRPPHLVEKLRMLGEGSLTQPLDWFDLCLHGSPWLLLLAKAAQFRRKR